MTQTSDVRTAVTDALNRDEAYDRDPQGDPPVSVARYRRAVRAALAVPPVSPGEVPVTWVDREARAYLAGHRDALAAVVRDIGAAVAGDAVAGDAG
jgi:hypothetical protein